MAPAPERAVTALNAMKAIGFPIHIAKPVLKNLLKVFENNWEYIEAENYRALADAILDVQESKDVGNKKQDAVVSDEPQPYRKRLRKQDEKRPSPSMLGSDGPGETSLKMPKLEAEVSPETRLRQRMPVSMQMNLRGKMTDTVLPQPSFSGMTTDVISPQPSLKENTTGIISPQPSLIEKTNGNISPQPSFREKTTGLVSPQPSRSSERAGPMISQINRRETRALTRAQEVSPAKEKAESSSLLTYRRDKRPVHERVGNVIGYKEPKVEPGIEVVPKNVMVSIPLRPKDEPVDDDSPKFEVPIAMICPPYPIPTGKEAHQYQPIQDDSSIENISILQTNASETLAAQHADEGNGKGSLTDVACKKRNTSELVSVQEASSANINIASSTLGEVKLSLTSDCPGFHMPSLDAVIRMVEDKCLKTYKFLQPNFFMDLMKEMCQCAAELGSESTDDRQENIVKVTPVLESLNRSGVYSMFDGMPACSLYSSLKLSASEGSGLLSVNGLRANEKVHGNKENDRSWKKKNSIALEGSNVTSHSLVVVRQPQLALGDVRPLHDANDISKGEERVRISLVNEISSENYPPCFHYIPNNIVYQNAYVNFSLARIGDEDCCSDCFGDCTAAAIPCACARETGGEFAYTPDGLVKKEFLDECISMNRVPQKHHHFYCKVCPLEKSKNEVMPDPCKGHLVRKFIKECWSKCGCNKQCGNRVVQRGITCNLQVFLTAEGKGWGLRTLDELPRGAFVCEYVGEVLTNMELYDRTIQTTGNARHTYPVLLDADWGSEGVLKDEEALCLDATFYGNVARFVNHRCFDANLVEIPVEVETPDHHYYHLAFFTTRKIEAYEELTWDYGIDFDDHHHPIKAFRCSCGSKFCRDMKRSRTRSKAMVLK